MPPLRQRQATLVPVLLVTLFAAAPGRPNDTAPRTGHPTFAGEALRYRIRIGPLTTGEAALITRRRDRGPHGPAVTIRLTARSRGLLDALYPVRDRITSVATADGFRTLGLQRRIREGRNRLVDHWRVDPDRGLARERDGRTVAVPPGIHDILSALWRLRVAAPGSTSTLALPLLAGDRLATLHVAAGPTREVTVPAGTFRCRPVVTGLDEPAVWDPDAAVVVDLALDAAMAPVRVRLPLPRVGAVTAELESVVTAPSNE